MANTGVAVVLGAQWGDEGKGKIVDMLAEKAIAVCRCQGGNNAGHTVIIGENNFDFHLLPSGIVHENCTSIIGNGVVVHVPGLFAEIEQNEKKGLVGWEKRLLVSSRAHLVFDFHQSMDGLQEAEKGKGSIGTTKKGIGPCYASKANRTGVRVGDLVGDYQHFTTMLRRLFDCSVKRFPQLEEMVDIEKEIELYKEYAERLRPLVCDTVVAVHELIQQKSGLVIVEGANAAMLDIDFGTYPYVTSSNCTVGAVCTGLGVPPRLVQQVHGVTKAYTTRVGGGAFPTELENDIGQLLRDRGHEYGVTTGRPRRCGWLDIVALRYSAMVNGYTSLAVTKLDILDVFDEIKIGVKYTGPDGNEMRGVPSEQCVLERVTVEYITLPGWKESISACTTFDSLPVNAQAYVRKLEALAGVPVQWIGVGAERSSTIQLF
ncbi:adenylosuccinate synthetase isozyme 1-like [Sycon ciliatum]|uniref:adenylosuccinate synthetase isozyme 1-like n=1 Tax=Sycon ciliatum TaxID=27933 RepID=UPI0031F6B782